VLSLEDDIVGFLIPHWAPPRSLSLLIWIHLTYTSPGGRSDPSSTMLKKSMGNSSLMHLFEPFLSTNATLDDLAHLLQHGGLKGQPLHAALHQSSVLFAWCTSSVCLLRLPRLYKVEAHLWSNTVPKGAHRNLRHGTKVCMLRRLWIQRLPQHAQSSHPLSNLQTTVSGTHQQWLAHD
jgi:hypothetical protein